MGVQFDTLDYVKTLTDAGVETAHAEAMARAQVKILGDLVTSELATKSDLKVLKAEILSEISGLRAETKSEFDGLRAELKSEMAVLTSSLQGEFRTELRSLKYGAAIAAFAVSLVVVLIRLIG